MKTKPPLPSCRCCWGTTASPACGRLPGHGYVNGEESAGFDLADPKDSWDAAYSTPHLVVNYVGLIDELAVFDRMLTPGEVRLLYGTANLPSSLMR